MLVFTLVLSIAAVPAAAQRSEGQAGRVARPERLVKIPNRKPRNIVLILADDHRYDALGFLGHPFLQTPNLDAMARGGIHFPNAFVTTALCSPSRASILTGLYAHRHRVVDNNNPVPPGTVFFSQQLKQAGYETAFIGKWHMGGEGDDPQPGFDHWISFRGQGTYLPSKDGLNVNGRRVPQKGYITDELTDYAIDWLKSRRGDRPFMLYLSHKAVHAEFIPADRHKDRYRGKTFTPPASIEAAADGSDGRPRWVRDQRNSWHGVEFPYHSDLDIAEYYRRYTETLLAVDDSVGRVMEELRRRGMLDSTLIVYMGDNGFAFGEHGLIDKRTAYEESMRVPMIAHCPEMFGTSGRKVNQVVANIDIAPTFLEAAALRAQQYMDGRSFLPIAEAKQPAGKQTEWRSALLYEYYWERNFPQTPTIHALRGDRYKYIHYHGIWDTDELYDLENDPLERRNLINDPAHAETAKRMNKELFGMLERSNGMYIPLYPDRGNQQNKRKKDGSRRADFPPGIYQEKSN